MRVKRFTIFRKNNFVAFVIALALLLIVSPLAAPAAKQSAAALEDHADKSLAKEMKQLVERFEDEGEFTDDRAPHALKLHLISLIQYERKAEAYKIVKHTESFKQLLRHQLEQDLIAERAFSVLTENANQLIEEWGIDFDPEKAMEHLRHLSVDIGPRVGGSDAEKEAAAYIKDELEHLGYAVSMQEFNFDKRRVDKLTIISNDNQEIPLRSATDSAETGEEGITANVVDAGMGQPGDFPESVEGHIAFIKRGKSNFLNAAKRAAEAGAIGLIIADNTDALRAFRPGLSGEKGPIPVVGITQADGEALQSQISEGEVEANLKVQTLTDQTSQNVIAVKKPDNIENPEIVYVTAHYDTVPFSPGANDDGSGTAVLLELARVLKDISVKREVRFIAFGHEESGLVGSKVGSEYYISQLSEAEIDRSIADFQMDMVGTNWEPASQLNVNVVDGQPNLVWQYAQAAADRLDMDSLLLYKRGASDHESFHNVGIDAANISWRVPGTADVEPYYHSPHDTIERISPEKIQTVGELIQAAVSDLVRR